jgi:hypothetical protein
MEEMMKSKFVIAFAAAIALVFAFLGCDLQDEQAGNDGPSEIHYDSDNSGSFYYPANTAYEGAIRLSAVKLSPYKGAYIQKVKFYLVNKPETLYVKAYNTGSASGPGTLLCSSFVPSSQLTPNSWNEAQLQFSPLVGTTDIWLGVAITTSDPMKPIIGTDKGPAYTDGDFVYVNSTWTHLGLDTNLNIRGITD